MRRSLSDTYSYLCTHIYYNTHRHIHTYTHEYVHTYLPTFAFLSLHRTSNEIFSSQGVDTDISTEQLELPISYI